jgi:hypothetical protein
MTFYSEMAEMATELITEFGQDIVITRETEEEINPVTGEVEVEANTQEFIVKGVMKKYPENLVDETRITSSDREIIIEASVVEPLLTDTVSINSQEWPIMEIHSINPAGTPLVYSMRVRR